VLELGKLTRTTIGKLVKVLPTSVVATAMRPSLSRRDLESRAEAIIETLRAVGANLGVRPAARPSKKLRNPRSAGYPRLRSRALPRARPQRADGTTPDASNTCSRRIQPYALMLDAASKAFFQTLSNSQTLKRLASRHGISGPHAFARRFIAGENLDDAIAALSEIQAQGLHSTLDYLGESVASLAAAETATQEYLTLIEAVDQAGVERNLSLKLTQLGLDVDRAMCVDNLRKILHAAAAAGFSSGSTWRAPRTPR
jgi:hypothetical protein